MLKPSARIDAIERAHATLGLPFAEIAHILLTGESTLYRWRAGTSAPTGVNRARLLMLDELLDALEGGFPDQDAAREWLDTPFSPFAGRAPRTLLLEGRAETLVGALAVLACPPTATASTTASTPTVAPVVPVVAPAEGPLGGGVPAVAVPPLPGPWSAREAVLRAIPREG